MARGNLEQAPERDLGSRLSTLEAELRVLRREYGVAAPRTSPLPSGDFEILRCRVGGGCYGLLVDRVREIVRYVEVTPVADVPDVVAGAIDVRGEIVAVIDARRRFGKAVTPPRRGTAIVLLSAGGRSVGLVVDEVLDVAPVNGTMLTEPSGLLARAEAVLAIASLHVDIVQIVDLERMLDTAEWEQIALAIDSVPPSTVGAATTDEGSIDERW